MTRKKLFLGLALILSAGIVVWGFNLARHSIKLYKTRQEIKSMLAGGLDIISPSYGYNLIKEVDRDLEVIDRSLAWSYPILNLTGKMTSQVQPVVKYLKSITSYALIFEDKVSPLLDDQINDSFQMLEIVNDFLNDPTLMEQAQFYSQEIERNHAKIDISSLPERFQDDFQMIEPFVPVIVSSGKILPLLPDLVGMQNPAHYLLLALNHDELRAGGGFITAMGTVSLNSLVDIDLDMQDSYQVDDLSKPYPLPPKPLQDYMLAGIWVPRDGNWSADFPASARKVQELYQLSTDQITNGVIAFDQTTVQRFLEVMGPINVDPGQGIWVNASNVNEYMVESWGQDPESESWWANRKDFISILGKAMLQSLLSTRDYKQIIELAKTSQDLIKTGHLMLYFNEETMQNLLAEMQLDSSVNFQTGDFLYWVDSNIGFNKVDAILIRNLTYEVDLTDLENPKAHLTMEYEHPFEMDVLCVHEATYGQEIAYTNMFQRCYWNYWRVYTAPTTKLVNASVQFIPGEFLLSGKEWKGNLDLESDLPGLGMVAGLQVVPTNSIRKIELDFDLSPEILKFENDQIRYDLEILKQMGLDKLPFNLKIIIPENFTFLNLPDGSTIDHNWVIIEKEIDMKQNLNFLFTQSE